MLVSIIVPVFNVERYLRQCLDSLRVQTLEDIEIICVDDGSTDDSLAILREYERLDSRFKVITKPNAGYGHTMNRGFAAASAPYVGVLESDDFCAPNMCEDLYRAACSLGVDIVRADLMLYWSQPEERTDLAHYVIADDCGELFDPRMHKRCFLLPPALCCMLVRRNLIVDNDLRLLETPGASYQDTSFSFKLWACARKAVMLSDAYVYYRQDNESSSINQPGKLYCVPEEYHELERFLLDDTQRFKALLPLMWRRKFGAYFWNYERIAPEYHEEFATYASHEFRNAYDQSLLNPTLFSSEEWSDLELLLEDPQQFVLRMDEWSPYAVKRFHLKMRIGRKLRGGRMM